MEDRRLAAIMFTDIVGYTALMGSNEDKAFQLLRKNRDLQRPLIKKYRGEWLKEMGDGILASFNTASDAVRCAGEIQNEAKKAGIPLRIGIHEGEVVFEGGDVLGDGVNVASRLEELAEEGCINISGAVYKDIKNKAGISIEFVEEKILKNVDEPIKVYKVQCEEQEQSIEEPDKSEKTARKIKFFYIILAVVVAIVALLIWYTQPTETVVEPDKSIAVLPFANLSNDPDQEYFSDGMMDEILMHLYKIGDLDVTSRTSVMQYKGTTKTVPQIAKELGVVHVLEGSVRKTEDRVRITVQLIDAFHDKHLWAESYDRDLKDVFAIQSDVAQKIAEALKTEITPEVKKRIESIPTENTEAYSLYLQARFLLSNDVANYNESTQILLKKAITLDPEFAEAYAELGWYWLVRGNFISDLDPEEVLKKALPMLNKSVEIKRDLADVHLNLACYYLWYEWDFQTAEKEYNIFVKLNPSNKDRSSLFSDLFLATGRFNQALKFSENNLKDEPNYIGHWLATALGYYFTDQEEKAIRQIKTAMKMFPQNEYFLGGAARIYVYAGRYESAIELTKRILEIRDIRYPRLLGNLAIAYYHTGEENKAREIMEELQQKSELSSVGSPYFYIAMIYAQMGETDLAFKCLDKAYKAHEIEMYWLKVEPPFEPLRSNPRFQVMLDKIGYPD